jgi:hypothetical protein
MKILIPENCVLWTNKGMCFPKDLTYGTEIFTIDPENKLVTTPVTDDLEEPEPMKVHTILTKNNICTMIPNYKIQINKKLIDVAKIKKEESIGFVDITYVTEYKEFQNEHTSEYLDKSPFSVTGASYLGSCGIKDSREAAYFQMPDEESMQKFAKDLQEKLVSELGGSVSATKGVTSQSKWGDKDASYLVLYRSDKFYKYRKSIKLTEDKILNSIYLNGINIYFGFLRSLFTTGFTYHLNSFMRGISDNKYPILNLPWRSKVRKLLQNSCHLWDVFQLSTYETKTQMNVDEVKIEKKENIFSKSNVLEIKEHLMECYEIEIPLGNKIIADNIILKPFELTEDEINELGTFEEQVDFDLEKIRKKITMAITSDTNNLKMINTLKIKKDFGLHVLGIIKNKGKVMESSTRYGKTVSTTAILSDETGEIKIKIWGEISDEIENGDALELIRAYTKNGILINSKDGYEKIYKMEDN